MAAASQLVAPLQQVLRGFETTGVVLLLHWRAASRATAAFTATLRRRAQRSMMAAVRTTSAKLVRGGCEGTRKRPCSSPSIATVDGYTHAWHHDDDRHDHVIQNKQQRPPAHARTKKQKNRTYTTMSKTYTKMSTRFVRPCERAVFSGCSVIDSTVIQDDTPHYCKNIVGSECKHDMRTRFQCINAYSTLSQYIFEVLQLLLIAPSRYNIG